MMPPTWLVAVSSRSVNPDAGVGRGDRAVVRDAAGEIRFRIDIYAKAFCRADRAEVDDAAQKRVQDADIDPGLVRIDQAAVADPAEESRHVNLDGITAGRGERAAVRDAA